MDMESTRRSFDRSREPGAKKPRLINELDRGSNLGARPFPQRQAPSAVTTLASASVRFRTNNDRDSESSEPGRGGYYPQPPPHQELVTQYKTALAELTFNSKPIITNLTIIAGENLSAAKAIAGTVCANILEVPSEQKLPSLYLLDSIVKNIGRDYIKHFAARLHEVFCKAYRHVDPSVHSSMRHLFGTWKGVFPPQTLQIIEKELGFNPGANGSASASATLRSDSQTQRPPHSIHVNPKYLERQRLQQSSRTKEVVNDMTGAILNSNENPERPDKTSGASRPWLDPRINMHNNQRIHRDAFNESIPEKSTAASYGGIEYSSDISSKLGSGIGRTGSRVMDLGHEKSWYKEGSGVAEIISGQSNGFGLKHGFSDHEPPKPMNSDAHFHPKQIHITNEKSSLVSGNWKNSEEEEFMWNEMNSGSTGHGVPDVANNLSTGPWTVDDENLEGEDHIQITHPFRTKADREISTVRKQPHAFGGHPSLSWKLQEQHSIEKLNMKSGHSEGFASTLGGLPGNKNSSAVRMGNRSFMPNATTGMAENMGQQQVDSVGVESPSEQSPPRPSPSPSLTVRHLNPIQKLAEKDHLQALKTPQFLGGLQSHYIRDPSPALPPNVQVGNKKRSWEKDSQGTLSSVTSFQPRNQQQQLRPSQTEVTVKTKKFPQSKVSLASDTSELSAKSGLSAAAVKSGNVSKKSIMSSIATSGLDARNLPSDLGVRATQSDGPSPTTSPSSLSLPNDDSSSQPKVLKAKAGQTPRVSIKPPASSNVSSASAPTSSAADNNSLNPIANLLSSLVAKGLISAETDSPTKIPTEIAQLEDQSESNTACSSLQAASVSAAVPVPSTRDEVVDNAKSAIASCHPTNTEIRNLIGFDFKPDVIRELHPAVIQELLDDHPHCCEACGIRLKQQEQFNKHLKWHATREREQNGLVEASRKWYAKSNAWIAGKAEYPSEFTDSDKDVYDNKSDGSQLDTMVLADENQCLCVLCGELFEDVYCQERNEWMFKAAVYMNNSDSNSEMGSTNVGPIIHAECLSEYSTSSVTMTEQD